MNPYLLTFRGFQGGLAPLGSELPRRAEGEKGATTSKNRRGITYLKIPPGRHSRKSGNPEDGYRLPQGRRLVTPGVSLVTPAKAGV